MPAALPARIGDFQSRPCVLFCSFRRSSKCLVALARHLQQANIETDTSRQSEQVRWPQSKHLTLNTGHSGRLLICGYGVAYCHYSRGEVQRYDGT